MIEIHLYGKLRRFVPGSDVRSDTVLRIAHETGDTVCNVVARIGISLDEVGSNIFLNGRYAALNSPIEDGARLGLFPDDMQLLYKWYFSPREGVGAANEDSQPPSEDSALSADKEAEK